LAPRLGIANPARRVQGERISRFPVALTHRRESIDKRFCCRIQLWSTFFVIDENRLVEQVMERSSELVRSAPYLGRP